jgi:phospholipid/cholesterol/gamma-HCH transport system ATP-binding protein
METAATPEVKIAIRGLHKSFGKNHVLRGIDLDVHTGETVTIFGNSGCGKSTLIKHLMGLLKPDQGSIIIDGRDFTALSRRELQSFRLRLGVVFQSAALLASMTVYENIALPLVEHTKKSRKAIRDIVAEKLHLVYLREDIMDLKPDNLSGGMRKRVGIARAIALDPDIILYDEPTTGLDPVISQGINELIVSLQERLGVTSIVISHDIHGAKFTSDRMVMLFKGLVEEDLPVDRIDQSASAAVQQLLHASTTGPLTEGFN